MRTHKHCFEQVSNDSKIFFCYKDYKCGCGKYKLICIPNKNAVIIFGLILFSIIFSFIYGCFIIK